MESIKPSEYHQARGLYLLDFLLQEFTLTKTQADCRADTSESQPNLAHEIDSSSAGA
jgi:hypothetical protein